MDNTNTQDQVANPLQPSQTNFAWERLGRLRAISLVQMSLVAPFFTGWSLYGVVMFVKLNSDAFPCETASQHNESYAFLIFWFILSFVLIFSYVCLLFYGWA